jgi:hypothetical protein
MSLLFLSVGLEAQTGRVPHVVTNPTEYVAWCPLWRTDGGFRSTIRLTNHNQTAPTGAVITLYMADGTPYRLPPVQIPMNGVQTVEVNAALATAPAAVQPHLSTFGSATITYTYDSDSVICGQMAMVDLPRSLDYTYSFAPPSLGRIRPTGVVTPATAEPVRGPDGMQVYEGLWWRHTAGAAGFVALLNTTMQSVSADLTITGLSRPGARRLTLLPHQTQWIDLSEFFAGEQARVGGIRVAYTGQPYAILVAAGLEDPGRGYSTNLPIYLPRADARPPGLREYAAVGIMVNKQDPLLNFPTHVAFSPYAFFRNVASAPRTLNFQVYYNEGRQSAATLRMSKLVLEPGEARELPIKYLLSSRHQVDAISLVFSYEGSDDDILSGIGSVDAVGSYVFPVPPGAMGRGGPQESPYWLASGGFDTMYTLWNPDTEAQNYEVRLFYGAKGESYRMQVRLEPRTSTMIDIGELIDQRQPDQDGRLLPLDATHGSLLVTSPQNDPRDKISLVLAGGIYNPTKATCGMTWITCPGFTAVWMRPDSFSVYVGGQKQLNFGITDSGSGDINLNQVSNWTSNPSERATVQAGLVTGSNAGSGAITALTLDGYPPYVYQWYGTPPSCVSVPLSFLGAGAGATVVAPTSLEVLSVTSLGCPGGANYGIQVDIKYQVLDQDSQPLRVSGMIPWETGEFWSSSPGPYDHELGASTAADGTFHDTPFGVCSNMPINTDLTSTQNISMRLGAGSYPVRSQSWTLSDLHGAAGFGHGTITNGSDINASR